jgi:formylglycine-generating enzyme required for sulfatase activity/tRNA A-37 threonylcarbamoyl transferase component Bud32
MLEPGDKIGDYTLVRFLGKGQFGEVWLAEKELQLSKKKFQHALKFLFNPGDEINLKSAQAEIDTWIESSGHPNVMSVLDMLVYNDHIVIASEYAEGGSLKSWLSQSNGRAPSHEKALEMMTGILSGIEHLHSRNVVHRDLKPDNILLQNNFPRITDFGISRIISAGSMSTVAMGSPFYMSPESFDGSKSTQTDIWSAGVVLYEMLSGEHPYRSETIYGLVTAIRQAEPKPLPEYIPPELRQIVDRALQKDLTRRYQTAQDMRWAVERQIYNLRMRPKEVTEPVAIAPPPIVDPAATLVEGYIDNSKPTETYFGPPAETPLSKAKEAQTEVLNIEASGDGALAEYLRETPTADSPGRGGVDTSVLPAPEMPPVQDSPSIPDVSGKVSKASAVARFMEAIDQEFQSSPNVLLSDPQPIVAEEAVAEAPIVEQPRSEFENSGFAKTGKPLVLIGGIGGAVVIFGLLCILAVVGIFFVTRSLLDRPGPVASGQSTTAETKTQTVAPAAPPPPAPADMVYIEGGEFIMGSDSSDLPDAGPAHKVTLQSFFMDIYEVTNEQYKEFMTSSGHKEPQGWKNGNYPNGQGHYPVVGVDWEDATAYAAWAKKRLPTEEEWELAARGKDGRLYPWGNEWRPGFANVDRASSTLSEVDKFANGKSPYGVYAMVGNAGEWTADDFAAYPGGKLSPYYAGKSGLKTIRGNDYQAERKYATTTFRLGYKPTGAEYSLTGFRCAKDAEVK